MKNLRIRTLRTTLKPCLSTWVQNMSVETQAPLALLMAPAPCQLWSSSSADIGWVIDTWATISLLKISEKPLQWATLTCSFHSKRMAWLAQGSLITSPEEGNGVSPLRKEIYLYFIWLHLSYATMSCIIFPKIPHPSIVPLSLFHPTAPHGAKQKAGPMAAPLPPRLWFLYCAFYKNSIKFHLLCFQCK